MTTRRPPRQATSAPGYDPSPDDRQVLISAEVARLFRVTSRTVTNWANAGKLRSFRTPGGQHRFYAADIRQHLEPDRLASCLPNAA